ncbi:hypothetical protein B0H13DRAFT_1860995 [Mycena leptocephala]|nr:hypothetical protein B0H13DRAFT_1860995 [Mycena leptocephala]
MKYILSAIFISLAVGSATALHTQEPGPDAIRSADTCGDQTNAQPFYRTYRPTNTDHWYTTNVGLVINAVVNLQSLEGVAALVFVTQEESTVPFYRLFNTATTDNFYTISTTERDNALQNGYAHVTQDPFTYIYPTQMCGSVPFYRLYHETKKINFYTTSVSERLAFITSQGYTDIDIAGYVLPVAPTQCT